MIFKSSKYPNKIPSSKNRTFIFKYSHTQSLLDIVFEPFESLALENLYLILKFYLLNNTYIIKNIYTIMEEGDSRVVFLQGLDYRRLSRGNFHDFSRYFWEFINRDEVYSVEKGVYGLRISFYANSPGLVEGLTYPSFPWDLKIFEILVGKYTNVQEEIIRLKRALSRERYLRLNFTLYIYARRNIKIRRKVPKY